MAFFFLSIVVTRYFTACYIYIYIYMLIMYISRNPEKKHALFGLHLRQKHIPFQTHIDRKWDNNSNLFMEINLVWAFVYYFTKSFQFNYEIIRTVKANASQYVYGWVCVCVCVHIVYRQLILELYILQYDSTVYRYIYTRRQSIEQKRFLHCAVPRCFHSFFSLTLSLLIVLFSICYLHSLSDSNNGSCSYDFTLTLSSSHSSIALANAFPRCTRSQIFWNVFYYYCHSRFVYTSMHVCMYIYYVCHLEISQLQENKWRQALIEFAYKFLVVWDTISPSFLSMYCTIHLYVAVEWKNNASFMSFHRTHAVFILNLLHTLKYTCMHIYALI